MGGKRRSAESEEDGGGGGGGDYDNDPRWADYWSNALVPPHMASRSDVVDHFKRKFYQRYIDPDLVIEAMPSSSSSQSAMPTPSSSSNANDQARPCNSGDIGSTTRMSGSSTTATPNPTSLHLDRPTIHFAVNAWIGVCENVVVGIWCTVYTAWSVCLKARTIQDVTLNPAYLFHNSKNLEHGICRPCKSGSSPWLRPRTLFTSFTVLLLSLHIFTPDYFVAVALITILSRALEHVVKFLRRNFSRSSLYRKYLEEPCVWVESNTTKLSILSSHAEIALGFLLILSQFSWQRNMIQTFMYWQLLKLMYNSPATAGCHQNVWAKIGRTVNPLVHRYAPFLNTPISAVQRWWFR